VLVGLGRISLVTGNRSCVRSGVNVPPSISCAGGKFAVKPIALAK